jgi:hypothetical protein
MRKCPRTSCPNDRIKMIDLHVHNFTQSLHLVAERIFENIYLSLHSGSTILNSVQDQGSKLNTLSRGKIRRSRKPKSRMCTLPCNAILLQTIEMFEYPSLVWSLLVQIAPLMLHSITTLQNAIAPGTPIIVAGKLHIIGVLYTLRIQKC